MSEVTHTTEDALGDEQRTALPPERAGISLADPAARRAFANVFESLGLSVHDVDGENPTVEQLTNLELVVADEAAAHRMRPLLDRSQNSGDSLKPALVAVGRQNPGENDSFDAYIAVPSMLAEVAARLSVVLYAHRALARRYKSALEELSLNRNIFRSVTNGISVANAQQPDMPLVYVNPSFELMTGYSLEDIHGKNCRFLQGDDRDQPGLTLVREAIAQRRQTTAILRNYRKDGTCFWNELTMSPIFNHEGVLTHFVGIQLDVTDRVKVETALRESEKLAAVGRLASTISHEINNPLEAVTNLVYLSRHSLPEVEGNEEVRRYLDTADEELRRVKLIASQSLRFAKQSSKPAAVLINETVTSMLDVYRARIRNYGVEARLQLRSTQHVVVFESELRQVLSNLVNNAIDAMKGSPRRLLCVRTREATDFRSGRTGVLITIADCGSGIPEESRDDVFKAFFSTKGLSGTGLGLWIANGIIERHHGVLLFRSSTSGPHMGTTFQLFLPFQAATAEDV